MGRRPRLGEKPERPSSVIPRARSSSAKPGKLLLAFGTQRPGKEPSPSSAKTGIKKKRRGGGQCTEADSDSAHPTNGPLLHLEATLAAAATKQRPAPQSARRERESQPPHMASVLGGGPHPAPAAATDAMEVDPPRVSVDGKVSVFLSAPVSLSLSDIDPARAAGSIPHLATEICSLSPGRICPAPC
jgi:hypothetical protein